MHFADSRVREHEDRRQAAAMGVFESGPPIV